MIELGKYQILKVVRKSTIGVYLGDEREQVLLPKKQVPQDISVGDVTLDQCMNPEDIDAFLDREIPAEETK